MTQRLEGQDEGLRTFSDPTIRRAAEENGRRRSMGRQLLRTAHRGGA